MNFRSTSLSDHFDNQSSVTARKALSSSLISNPKQPHLELISFREKMFANADDKGWTVSQETRRNHGERKDHEVQRDPFRHANEPRNQIIGSNTDAAGKSNQNLQKCNTCGEIGHIAEDCPKKRGNGERSGNEGTDSIESKNNSNGRCFNGEKSVHKSAECTEPKVTSKRPSKWPCYNCDQHGHEKKDCPQPKDKGKVNASFDAREARKNGRGPKWSDKCRERGMKILNAIVGFW